MYQLSETPPKSLISYASMPTTSNHVPGSPKLRHREGEDPEVIYAAWNVTSDMTHHDTLGGSRYSVSDPDTHDGGFETNSTRPDLSQDEDDVNARNMEVDEDDLTPFEYARYHRLTTDHFCENPLQNREFSTLLDHLEADLEDPGLAFETDPDVNLNTLDGYTFHERWEVDKESARFLASVLTLGKYDGLEFEGNSDGLPSFRDMKSGESILISDPELDLLRLKRRNMIRLSADGLTPFHIDEERGDGFPWTTENLELPAKKDAQVAHERLDIDEDTMRFIKAISNAPALNDKDIKHVLSTEKRVRLPSPETPPMMPISSPLRLGGLSDAAAEMELTSTPEDLAAIEAADMSLQIAKRDMSPADETASVWRVESGDVDHTSIYSPLKEMAVSSSSALTRKRPQDLKIDVPLTPLESKEPPMKKSKTVSFPEDLHSLIPSPESDMSMLDTQTAEQDSYSFITKTFQPLARAAIENIDNEQLLEFDTTMRLRVPQIDEIQPVPPWKVSNKVPSSGTAGLELQKAFLAQTKRELLDGQHTWSGISKTERMLPWSPFPARLGKVWLEETFDDGSLARYMAGLTVESDIDIASLISEPIILRDVDELDDEPLLEPIHCADHDEREPEPYAPPPSVPPPPEAAPIPAVAAKTEPSTRETIRMDMQTLLRKRKEELDVFYKPTKHDNEAKVLGYGGVGSQKVNGLTIAKPTRFSDFARAASGISRFLQVQGETLEADLQTDRPSPEHQNTAPSAIMIAHSGQEDDARANQQTVSVPAPILRSTAKSYPIVVSSSMLANRDLIRKVQNLCPELELVERDAIATLSVIADQKPNQNYDADITVSSSTGIIVTTLQKLKQKPLPGQSIFFGPRERIATVSVRYNNLIVLVSEARQPDADAGVLDERDTETLSDLTGYTATLHNDVSIFYVPGSESELATWIAAVVSRNAIPEDNPALLTDETFWERFLRVAGLNPAAAQYILSQLKMPHEAQGDETSSTLAGSRMNGHGLAAFVQLGIKQQRERFGQFIADSVLLGINDMVNSPWMSMQGDST